MIFFFHVVKPDDFHQLLLRTKVEGGSLLLHYLNPPLDVLFLTHYLISLSKDKHYDLS